MSLNLPSHALPIQKPWPNGKFVPPEIPHVTNNIVPLSNVLRFHTQEAYKQLSRQIESLAHTRTSESDAARKRKLLAVIVALRHDFVKLYTLVKWAQRSKDVSKLIDVLNYLRGQEFYFDNLLLGIHALNHFSGAKLPLLDLLTAMEVLVKKRPQLPSYNYLETPPVSPQRVLQVLRDLNLALTARMALEDDMPARFRHNYTVRDGRVTFELAHEFRVSVSVASDAVTVSAAEYAQLPFFFIDFAFLFGVNQANSLTTHDRAEIATQLPKQAWVQLERVANRVLLQLSLSGLYDVLHKYASAFKLYLILRQLRVLAINSKWRGNIQFRPSAFLVVVNYWLGHFLSRNWRLFVEIGIDKQYDLHVRWFKNGRYDLKHGIEDIGTQPDGDTRELNIDYVLSLVINKHLEILIKKVFDAFQSAVPENTVLQMSPYQLLLKLTPRKLTVFAIDPLTGHFYFLNPSPTETAIQHKINTKPAVVKNKNFISESDLVANIVSQLTQLRTENLSKTCKMRLVTMGWVANENVRILDAETAKLLSLADPSVSATHTKLGFFRSRTWPPLWFLLNMVSGANLHTHWWVARLKSVKGEWIVQWVQNISLGDAEMDHAFCRALARTSSNSIIHHLIVEELQAQDIAFVKLADESVLDKFDFSHPHAHAESRAVMALHNLNNLLPVLSLASTLFLACLFSLEGRANELHVTIFGPLRGKTENDARSLSKLGANVDLEKSQFHVHSTVDLSNRLNTDEPSGAKSMLGPVLASLAKMNLLIKILEQVRSTTLTVTSSSYNELSFEVHPYYKPFILRVQSDNNLAFVLGAGAGEKGNVEILVRLLNREFDRSGGALLGAFRYLQETVSIFEAADAVQEELAPAHKYVLQNSLQRLHFEPKFVSLNLFNFVFGLNSTVSGAPKKIQHDKITFSVSFKKDRFAKNQKLLLKFSMKDNFNSQNIKFKKLFETIFAELNEVHKDAIAKKDTFMKLYYDFVIDCSLLKPLMIRITRAFVEFLGSPQS